MLVTIQWEALNLLVCIKPNSPNPILVQRPQMVTFYKLEIFNNLAHGWLKLLMDFHSIGSIHLWTFTYWLINSIKGQTENELQSGLVLIPTQMTQRSFQSIQMQQSKLFTSAQPEEIQLWFESHADSRWLIHLFWSLNAALGQKPSILWAQCAGWDFPDT